jgi:hypothetical protein
LRLIVNILLTKLICIMAVSHYGKFKLEAVKKLKMFHRSSQKPNSHFIQYHLVKNVSRQLPKKI